MESRVRAVVGEDPLAVELDAIFRPGWFDRREALGTLVDEVLGELLVREGLEDEIPPTQWELELQTLFDLLNERRLDLD